MPVTSPRSELLTVIAGCSFPPLMRMDAAVRAASAGHNPSRPPTAKLAGLETLFGLYRDMGCPPLLIEACKAYTQKSSDELPLLTPLVWSMWKETGSPTATLEHSAVSDDIGAGMPNYAFDPVHTRPGIRAVTRWLDEVPDKCPWTPRQVAHALWFHESAVCKQTLDWPIAHRLRSDCERGELLRTGVRPDECEDLIHWVRQHYPELDPVRRRIWTAIYRHARWTDAAFEIVDDASCNQSTES